jgi:hypothetical protein
MHIISETNHFVNEMKLALGTNENNDKQKHKDAVVMFENNSFPDARLEGPPTNDLVSQPESKDMLLQRLISLKEAVNVLCATVNLSAAKGKTRHPGLLYFSATEWLQFAEMHMRHHFKQKNRIEEKLWGNDRCTEKDVLQKRIDQKQ